MYRKNDFYQYIKSIILMNRSCKKTGNKMTNSCRNLIIFSLIIFFSGLIGCGASLVIIDKKYGKKYKKTMIYRGTGFIKPLIRKGVYDRELTAKLKKSINESVYRSLIKSALFETVLTDDINLAGIESNGRLFMKIKISARLTEKPDMTEIKLTASVYIFNYKKEQLYLQRHKAQGSGSSVTDAFNHAQKILVEKIMDDIGSGKFI